MPGVKFKKLRGPYQLYDVPSEEKLERMRLRAVIRQIWEEAEDEEFFPALSPGCAMTPRYIFDPHNVPDDDEKEY